MRNYGSILIIFTLLYSLTIEQFLMQLYLGCTLVSNLIHSLMLSNMFSAGGDAIFVASKPRGGAIFVASKTRGGAIFIAYHCIVLIKNAKFKKKIFLPSIYSFLYTIQSKYLLEFISQEKKQHQNEQILLFGTHFMRLFIIQKFL